MGAWGLGLFQSDHDLDIVADLSGDADVELYHPENPNDSRKHLDAGVLLRMVTKRLPDATNPGICRDDYDRPDYNLTLLGACAMALGCKLPAELREFMQKNYLKVGLPRDAKKQMEKGLEEYHDGVPFDFYSKGLNATMSAGGNDRDLLFPGGGSNGMIMMNTVDPHAPSWLTESTRRMAQKRAEEQGRAREHPSDACGYCGAKCTAKGDDLHKCSRCKKQLYCSRGCQKEHWKKHKKVCREPTTTISST